MYNSSYWFVLLHVLVSNLIIIRETYKPTHMNNEFI